jgi:hypothetical protein
VRKNADRHPGQEIAIVHSQGQMAHQTSKGKKP